MNQTQSEEKPFWGTCKLCHADGRTTSLGYRCFDCYEKEKLRDNYVTPKGWAEELAWYRKNRTEEELYLIIARKEYVIKRQFLGKTPDWLRVKYWEAKTCQAEAPATHKQDFDKEIQSLQNEINKRNSIGVD